MGKTIAEKILSIKSGIDAKRGDIVTAKIDFAMVPDAQGPWSIEPFNKLQNNKVFDREKIAFVIDHYVPCPNADVAAHHDLVREFCKEHGIKLYESGDGICHQILFEKGHIFPGGLFIGADSHSCSYGAVGALGTGVGSTDIAVAMHYGKLWFKVPESINIQLKGKLNKGVSAKDLALYIMGLLGADGAAYKSLEFSGAGIANLDMDDRFTICNLSVECGAKFGIMPFDEVTRNWCIEKNVDFSSAVSPDEDAVYESTLTIDLSQIKPSVAKPHKVDNYAELKEVLGTKIDMVLIGTCTNGRLKDFASAHEILKGREVCGTVELLIVPASRDVYIEAIKAGYIETFLKCGAKILPPGCGPCCGSSAGVPSAGANVLSTANRNFIGRMGNTQANIYLASPYAAAAAVITGKITDAEVFLNDN